MNLSWKLKWAFLIAGCPFFCPNSFHIFIFFSNHCSNEGPCPLTRGDKYEIAKIHYRNFKNLPPQNHWANFSQTWHKIALGGGNLSKFKWKVIPFSKARYLWNSENTLTRLIKQFFSRATGPISIKLGTKHLWVIGIKLSSTEGSYYGGPFRIYQKYFFIFLIRYIEF